MGRSIEPNGNMLKFQKLQKPIKLRTARGAYLLELLVAISVSGVMALALTTSITEGMRSTQASQNQVSATWLAKEAMERIKGSASVDDNETHYFSNTSGVLSVPNGTDVQFRLTSLDGPPPAYDFLQRPLLIDFETLKWKSSDMSGEIPGRFRGTVKAKFDYRNDGGRNVTVTVSWLQSNSTENKSFVLKGIIFPVKANP